MWSMWWRHEVIKMCFIQKWAKSLLWVKQKEYQLKIGWYSNIRHYGNPDRRVKISSNLKGGNFENVYKSNSKHKSKIKFNER